MNFDSFEISWPVFFLLFLVLLKNCNLPFDFILDFLNLNDIIMFGLLENRFNRIEAYEFDFGGTFAATTLCCDGRCGACAGCYSNRWCLKYIRSGWNDGCCGCTNGWHCFHRCNRQIYLTTVHYSTAAVGTRFAQLLVLFVTHNELTDMKNKL